MLQLENGLVFHWFRQRASGAQQCGRDCSCASYPCEGQLGPHRTL